MNHPDTSLY